MPQVLNLTYHLDGRVTNDTGNDPAAPRVVGYERFFIGVDLAQAGDFTSTVVIKDSCLPTIIDRRVQLGPRERTVVFADKFKGVSYVAVVDYLVRLKTAQPFAGRSQLLIDGTGLGRVVSDMLEEQNIPHTPITMTAGADWKRNGRYVNASKTLMIENTSVLFSSGDLKFAHDLQMREEIEQDLATFTLTTTNAGNQIITQARNANGHSDTAIALICASFGSQYLVPGIVGEAKLRGYY